MDQTQTAVDAARDRGAEHPGGSGLSRAVRGFGALVASNLLSQLIAFAALAYVARRIGAVNLGAYTFALTLTAYFGLIANLGVGYLGMRDVAQRPSRVASIVTEALAIQAPLSIVLYGALIALSPWLVHSATARRLIPIVGLTLLTNAAMLDWVLLALDRSRSVAMWRLAGQVVYGALVPVFVVGGVIGTIRYAELNIVGLVVTAVGIAWAVFRLAKLTPLPPSEGSWANARRHVPQRVRRSLPFGYSLAMIQVYAAVDILLLGYLDSTRAVGIYAAANKLPLAVNALANLWLNVFFPHAARRLAEEPKAFTQELGRVVTATIIIAVAISAGAVLCAGSLMPLLFGPAFRSAAVPFALLAISQALVLLQANFSNVLLAGGSERAYAAILTFAAAAIVVLDLLLIPPYGTVGAAVATLVAEAGLTAATLMGVIRRLGPVPLDAARLARGAGAIGVMCVAMLGARSLGGALVQVGAALIAFAGASIAFRPFDPQLFQRG
jgi:O-antigen/teichoic acid export membrane protein